jgi:hypothetical protein
MPHPANVLSADCSKDRGESSFVRPEKFHFLLERGLASRESLMRKPTGFSLPHTLLFGRYTLYADYVLKNPFYSLDMPIR